MNHDAAVQRIDDLVHGRLGDGTKDGVMAHLRSCGECRSLSEARLLLAEAWVPGPAERHPSSESIVLFALENDRLEATERVRIATHVSTCIGCASEVQATIRTDAEVSDESPRSANDVANARRGNRALVGAVAVAVFAVALLAFPTYRALFYSSPEPSGPVSMLLLQSPLREAGSAVETIALAPDQSHVLLAVDTASLEQYPESEAIRFQVRDGRGRVVWSSSMSKSELRGYIESTQVLPLLVPAAILPDEPLTLRVQYGADPGNLVFEAPFAIERTR